MNNLEKNNIYDKNGELFKTSDYWKKQIEKTDIQLPFFNDVVTEYRPPHEDAGYQLMQSDIELPDGCVVDIYHTDKNEKDHFHRVFLHIKNEKKEL